MPIVASCLVSLDCDQYIKVIKKANLCLQNRQNRVSTQPEFEKEIEALLKLEVQLRKNMHAVSFNTKTISEQLNMLTNLSKKIELKIQDEKLYLQGDKTENVRNPREKLEIQQSINDFTENLKNIKAVLQTQALDDFIKK